ncbi:MAG: hypothetical protein DI626_11945, partial [Micavibrio aeruginosavorus]
IREAMEPFGQIHDPTRANTQQGTGLGLPLSKAMAELHGGTLDLHSDSGQGTIVTVRFTKERIRHKQQENLAKPAMDIIQSAE